MKGLVAALVLAGSALAVPHQQEQLLWDTPDQNILGNPQVQPSTDQQVVEGGSLFPPVEPPVLNYTWSIYETLSANPNYSKLVRLINFDPDFVGFLDNTNTTEITFFAVDNDGLTPPKHRKLKRRSRGHAFAALLEQFDALEASAVGGGDEDDEEKKKRLRKILHALLEYHSLQHRHSKAELYLNSTYATGRVAHDGSFDGQPRRLSITSGFLPFSPLRVNFYSTVLPWGVNATNGAVYGISRPLFPPPSILDELFLAENFVTSTSALQKVNLDKYLQWRWRKKSDDEEPTIDGKGSSVTFFAPTELAWRRLPHRLRTWLFSPFGEKALKKILSYHIVPDYLLYIDWVHNATKTEDDSVYIPDHDLSEDVLMGIASADHGKSITGGGHCRRRAPDFQGGLESSFRPRFGHPVPPRDRPSILHELHHPHHPPGKPSVSFVFNSSIPTLLEGEYLNITIIKPVRSLPPYDYHEVEGCVGMEEFTLDFSASPHPPHPPPPPPSPPSPPGAPHRPPPPPSPGHHKHPHPGRPLFRGLLTANHIGSTVEVPSRNGVVHGVNSLLHPHHHKEHDHDDEWSMDTMGMDDGIDHAWDDWESWLPAWAESA